MSLALLVEAFSSQDVGAYIEKRAGVAGPRVEGELAGSQ